MRDLPYRGRQEEGILGMISATVETIAYNERLCCFMIEATEGYACPIWCPIMGYLTGKYCYKYEVLEEGK